VPTLIAAWRTPFSIVAHFDVPHQFATWVVLGDHLCPETLNLILGHLLYGLLIGSIALFAAAISESAATAAIIALAFTVGSWVLDFGLAGQPGLLEWISRLSLTQTLLSFEQGLLSLSLLLGIIAGTSGFVAFIGMATSRSGAENQAPPLDSLCGHHRGRARLGHTNQNINRRQ
jgi:hypothetical protein